MNPAISLGFLVLVAVISYAAAETCAEMKARESRNSNAVLIPECEANGDFKALQCHKASVSSRGRFCQCWSRDGDVLSQPSTRLRHCDCYLNLNGAVPKDVCAPNGLFLTYRCLANVCACYDAHTGAQTKVSVSSASQCERN